MHFFFSFCLLFLTINNQQIVFILFWSLSRMVHCMIICKVMQRSVVQRCCVFSLAFAVAWHICISRDSYIVIWRLETFFSTNTMFQRSLTLACHEHCSTTTTRQEPIQDRWNGCQSKQFENEVIQLNLIFGNYKFLFVFVFVYSLNLNQTKIGHSLYW